MSTPARQTIVTSDPEEAAAFVRRGDVVAFPTETVYGIGANALDQAAVLKIYLVKGRPPDNPLIVHVAEPEQLSRVVRRVTPVAARLMEVFFPGPLTVILPRHPDLPLTATAGLETVGVRMPAHALAHAFLSACGVPVAAPSANRSGRPSPTTWTAVLEDLGGRVPCVLQGDPSAVGLESTVVDCTGDVPVVLRAGAVTLEALREVIAATRLAAGPDDPLARSPGTRYRHYAPTARVRLVDLPRDAEPGVDAAFIGLTPPPDPDAFRHVVVAPNVETYAHRLFDFFRRCDALGIRTIWCQRVAPYGLGLALLDRLTRAAQG